LVELKNGWMRRGSMAVAAATSNGEFHGSSIYGWFIVENTVSLMNMDDTWDG
jgi:hypothetical protein